MLVVTHEMDFAREVGDVVVIDAGGIIESGPPETIFTNPTQERARSFFASRAEAHLSEPPVHPPPSEKLS